MPFRVKRQTPLPFPMAKSPGFLTARNRALERYILALGPSPYLPLTDTDSDDWGSNSLARNHAYVGGVGAELLANGDFEAGDVNWAKSVALPSTITISGGVCAIEVISPQVQANINQDVLTLGDTYRFGYEIVSNPGGANLIIQKGNGGAENVPDTVGARSFHGIANGSDTKVRYQYSGADTGVLTIDNLSLRLSGQLDGEYVGPTINNDTFAGLPCPTFDGVNDYVQLEQTRLESETFSEALGSYGLAIEPTAANWNSASQFVFAVIGADASNRMLLYKQAANVLRFQVDVGAVTATADYTVVAGDHDKWLYPVCTWNSGGNISLHVKTSTATATYPAGTWAGTLAAAYCRLMSDNGSLFAPGSAASFFLDSDELSAAQALTLYNIAKAVEPLMA